MATPVWKLQRELANAQARATYYANYTPPTGRVRVSRPMNSFVYYSLFESKGAEQLSFKVNASQKSVDFFTATGLGITQDATEMGKALSKPDNLKPSIVKAVLGDSSPETVKPYGGTGYGYTRYYKVATGEAQSHYSAPISKKDTIPTVQDLKDMFSALVTAKTLELGANGRMYLQIERLTVPGG